jgi:hypothetical protein
MTGRGPRPCQIGNRAARAVARSTPAGHGWATEPSRAAGTPVCTSCGRARTRSQTRLHAARTDLHRSGTRLHAVRTGSGPSGTCLHAARTGSGPSGTCVHAARTRSAPAPDGFVTGADAICAQKQPACRLQTGLGSMQIAAALAADAIRTARNASAPCADTFLTARNAFAPCADTFLTARNAFARGADAIPIDTERVRAMCRLDSDGPAPVHARCRRDWDRANRLRDRSRRASAMCACVPGARAPPGEATSLGVRRTFTNVHEWARSSARACSTSMSLPAFICATLSRSDSCKAALSSSSR